MTKRDDLIRDRDYVNAELVRLHEAAEAGDLSAEDWTKADEGLAFVKRTDDEIARLDRLAAAAAAAVDRGAGEPGDDRPSLPNVNLNRNDDPYDLSTLSAVARGSDLVGRARTAIERTEGLSDGQAEQATRLVGRLSGANGALARHVLATGSAAYRSAFQKMLAGQSYLLDDVERRAMDAARALSLTDTAGGFAVPFTLDPSIISTNDVSTNPFRRIANVKTTLTNQWQGVSSAGMAVSWDGEAAQVSDDSPTLGDEPINVWKAQGFALGSIEISQDWAGIEGDLRAMIQEGKDDAEAVVFTTGAGDGSNQPTGVVTALAGSASEVNVSSTEDFVVADVYALENALPAKYRLSVLDGNVQSSRASWIANRAIYNEIRQFDTGGGAALWETLGGGLPARLLGHPTYEASAMDGAYDVGATANNYILALGDFRYFVIVDRVGLTVEYVPHIFGANGRPTGQRGWYCYWRVGSGVVNIDAFRLLDLPTTA